MKLPLWGRHYDLLFSLNEAGTREVAKQRLGDTESTLAQDVQDTGFGTQSPEHLVIYQTSSYLLGTR